MRAFTRPSGSWAGAVLGVLSAAPFSPRSNGGLAVPCGPAYALRDGRVHGFRVPVRGEGDGRVGVRGGRVRVSVRRSLRATELAGDGPFTRGGSARDGGEQRRGGGGGEGHRSGRAAALGSAAAGGGTWRCRSPSGREIVSCKSYIVPQRYCRWLEHGVRKRYLPVFSEGWTTDTVAAYMGPPALAVRMICSSEEPITTKTKNPSMTGPTAAVPGLLLSRMSTRPRLWRSCGTLAEEAAKTRLEAACARGGNRGRGARRSVVRMKRARIDARGRESDGASSGSGARGGETAGAE